MGDRIAVIGAGAWGTTLAVILANGSNPVTLWAHSASIREELAGHRENRRYLPGVTLPAAVAVAADTPDLAGPHRLVIVAVPSAHLREVATLVATVLAGGIPVLSAVKGIEAESHLRMSEVIAQELPGRPIAVLSGPNLAREIAAGKPAGTVVASADAALAVAIAGILGSPRLRVYTNPDVVGVELGGALKNVVALAAGMVDGLGLGDSAKAGIITRGLAEMTALGVAAGANPLTFAGLAGVGDLIATCMSPLSRNHQAGELIGTGVAPGDVEQRLPGIAEGIFTVRGALGLATSYDVELPIAAQVDAVVHAGRKPMDAVTALMSREPKDELANLPL